MKWLLPLFVSLCMIVASVAFQHGGVLNPEVETRLPFYLSEKPLLQKIYDSAILDGGMFQARELSYLFDYLDCRFIAFCVRMGFPHFLSLTHYIFLLIISLELWRFGTRDVKLRREIVLLTLLLFWTASPVFWDGNFFRTSKVGVALVLLILYRQIFRGLTEPEAGVESKTSRLKWIGMFGWACAATLFDRQGVFFVGTGLFVLLCWYIQNRRKTVLLMISALAFALVFSVIYNHIIAPLLTRWLNEYWPDYRYQHLPWANLMRTPVFYVRSAALLYLDAFRFLLGNLPVAAALALLLAFIGGAAFKPKNAGKTNSAGTVGFLLSQTILMWVMLALMILRHPWLLQPEVRQTYYILPLTVMLAMTLLLTCSKFQERYRLRDRWIELALCAGIIANVAALPSHRLIIMSGRSAGGLSSQAGPLLEALRNVRNPTYIAPPKIATNQVYQFFHEEIMGPKNKMRDK